MKKNGIELEEENQGKLLTLIYKLKYNQKNYEFIKSNNVL